MLTTRKISLFRIRSSLVYTDFDSDFGGPFDPDSFDEIEQPPPVHIIYPRPASCSPHHSIVLNEKVSASFYFILFAIQFCSVYRWDFHVRDAIFRNKLLNFQFS